jgi:hypothetical protein
MDASLWLSVAAILTGLPVAAYGLVIIFTGHIGRRDRRAFRAVHEAGRYYLCTGLGVSLLSVASLINGLFLEWLAIPLVFAAVALVGVASFRYRPRRQTTN